MRTLPIRNSGFALLVVLSTLAILATLTAVSTKTLVARSALSGGDTRLLERHAQSTRILNRLLAWPQSEESPLPSQFAFDGLTITLVDVGGYVDLNTGDPELIEALLLGITDDPQAFRRFRDWRRTPNRLTRVEDLARIAAFDLAETLDLDSIATVHSGRRGIDPNVGIRDVLQTLKLGDSSQLPERWITAATQTTFRVWITDPPPKRAIGVVRLPLAAQDRQILWME